jgi:phosphoribosyl 1,2-cyclic phosphodiesterase
VQLIVLGSGSAGNAALLCIDGETVLIDAGLSPRRVHRACVELDLPRPSRFLLTHPDSDHLYRTWSTWVNRGEVTLHLHAGHVGHANRAGFTSVGMETFNDSCQIGSVYIESHLMSHDDHGTCAFVLHVSGKRIGWATDLGRVTPELIRALADVDILAIESNYDRIMQETSDRPVFLKTRIMGGGGHLSNREALDAVRAIAESAPLQQIVLLHLSRQCNCPTRIADLWEAHAPHLVDRLVITSQHERVHIGSANSLA